MEDLGKLREILNNDPFEVEGPSDYEIYLHAALKLAFANVGALTHAVESLNARIEEHERLHTAANVAAMKVPDIVKDEMPN